MPLRNPNVKTYQSNEDDDQSYEEQPVQHLDFNKHYKHTYSHREMEEKAANHEHEFAQKNLKDKKSARDSYRQVAPFTLKKVKKDPY